MNEKANKLALQLQEKGVKPNTIVAIMVERSIEMVVTMAISPSKNPGKGEQQV